MYIPVNFLESKRITKLKFKIVAIIVKQQQPEEYSIFVCNESDLSQSVVVSVIVRSDRPWMAMCPSAATWWAAIIRAPWWYGVLPVITTPTIWGFLSTLKWRVSGWIPCIASWTDSWIIIAAWPSTFIVPWVCWLTRTSYAPYTQVLARSRCPSSLALCLHRKLKTLVVSARPYKWKSHWG